MKRWPLALIAPAAAVAIWSGWVGLGELCGFGPVHVLPGIAPRFVVNTAICLPVGMEAYAGFALGVWLRNTGVPDRAKAFAMWSAFGALTLGVLGQVAFHVLSSLHVQHAPIWVVVFVSCIPVGVLALAVALAHLMSPQEDEQEAVAGGEVPSSSLHAARMRLKAAAEHGFKVTPNDTQERFGLTRAAARGLHAEFAPKDSPAGSPPSPAGVNGNSPHG